MPPVPPVRRRSHRATRQLQRNREQERRAAVRQSVDDAQGGRSSFAAASVTNTTYKCALQMPAEVATFSLGAMDSTCSHCGAQHFRAEVTDNNTDAFTLCCHKGKVKLDPLTPSPFIQQLIVENRNYRDNIRSYNSAFAMVSSKAHLDESVTGGVYAFRIHNTIYHKIGGLMPSNPRQPKYAEVYWYDVDTAVQHRMRLPSNENCDPTLMRNIGIFLNETNPFVQSFKTMADIVRENGGTNDIRMYMTSDKNTDQRRYNQATMTDVAAIFRTTDGAPPGERHLIVQTKANELKYVSVLEPTLDALAYPLLFPSGDFGWHPNISHAENTTNRRQKVTMLQYTSYRLAILPGFSILHRSQKLFLQWVVDMYCRIEGTRLDFIRNNQSKLRADLYMNVTDYVRTAAERDGHHIGRQVILPSSFIGSPRNMNQNYQDAMAIVRKFGKPSLFITMTCNPKWPEITENLALGESAHFRPDLVARVFHCKLQELKKKIIKDRIFGECKAMVYSVEFQKRGLPHAHILVTLDESDRIRDVSDVDKFVSAEIPDPDTRPGLYEKVKKHMIHGPCGHLNPQSPCMNDNKCTKQYPKNFAEVTRDNVNGYAAYKRPDNARTVEVRGYTVDNRYVVPHNPFLLETFDCHINVEVCSTVKAIKYLFKYVYKGHDCATLRFETTNNTVEYDETKSYLNGRYVGSAEACWRIFGYEMHFQTHHIERLDCHLPNGQTVYYEDGHEERVVNNPKPTKLLAFFALNRDDEEARQILYTEIPQHYVWNDQSKKWTKRMRGASTTITRLYTVNPKNPELFHLRLLLLHVRGPTCFDDVKTVNGVVHDTFVAAAHARGIASNDNEWRDTLLEQITSQSPYQLRLLFAVICGLNFPSNAMQLWTEFRDHMCEDYMRQHSAEDAYNRGLLDINDILLTHNTSCAEQGLPTPRHMLDVAVDSYDVIEQGTEFERLYSLANDEQKAIIDMVLSAVLSESCAEKAFCLSALGGCGKTFVQQAIMYKLRSLSLDCIPCAFSGIAASLLNGGRTVHNVFKLPIPILETSTCGMTANSPQALRIAMSSLIIIDEISMCPVAALNAIDRFLRDIAPDSQRDVLFGGKAVLMCGDFRQTLPVIPHSGRVATIESCVKSFPHWSQIRQLSLTRNMRALSTETEFAQFLQDLGNGVIREECDLGPNIIEIPQRVVGKDSAVDFVYSNMDDIVNSHDITNRAILAPKNEDCSKLNTEILNKLPGEERHYYSFDKIVTDDDQEQNRFPTEFLNSLNVSGLPPHKLTLKVNAIVMLIRNFNTSRGLINGTRMRVRLMHQNTIDCEVLTGASQGSRVLIPRIHLRPSDTLLPFAMQRTQFPLIPAFATTINKAQGQSISTVAVYLPNPVFSHGQLYVAASRARSFDRLRMFIKDTKDQGHLRNDENIYTKNIVYREVLG